MSTADYNCAWIKYFIFQITGMIYTSSGGAILALTNNAVHKLWKWQQNELNPSGKVCHVLK